ncbi:MAG: lysozyme [Candidatus Paceibacterota bacterium]|jgi:lysozyme
MTTSQRGIDLIKHFEGLRLEAYQDSVGVWTIGYGHTENVYPGRVIDEYGADILLKDDLKRFEAGIDKLALSINQNQYDALVSFAFNLGLGNLSKSTLLKKVRVNPNDPTIADEFVKWIRAGGKVLPGLLTRRKAEAVLYFSQIA